MADIITAEERAHFKWVLSYATNEELAYGGRWFGDLRRLSPRTLAALEAAEAECERLKEELHNWRSAAEVEAGWVDEANAGAEERSQQLDDMAERAEKTEAENTFIHDKLAAFFSEYQAVEDGDSGKTTITVSTARAKLLQEVRDRLRAASVLKPDTDEIDVGYRYGLGGDKSHMWMEVKDVPGYCS